MLKLKSVTHIKTVFLSMMESRQTKYEIILEFGERVLFLGGGAVLARENITGYSPPHQPAVSGWNSNLRCCLSRRAAPKFFYHFSGTRLQFQPAVLSAGLEKSAGWWGGEYPVVTNLN